MVSGRWRKSPLRRMDRAASFARGPQQREVKVDQNILNQCQKIIGYRFKDLSLLSLALTHASVAQARVKSNERLEFLGDAVLDLTVCHELYSRYEDLLEGEMTMIKSSVVSRQTCAVIAEEIGLCEKLSMGKGMHSADGLPMSVSAAVFEAIIGAIYLDGGLGPVKRFILDRIEPHIAEALANEHQKNYKSMLQQYVQRKLGTTPLYVLLDEKGPDHSKCFEVAIQVEDRHFPSAWGKNKKEAEQAAARLAVSELGLLKDDRQDEEALPPQETAD